MIEMKKMMGLILSSTLTMSVFASTPIFWDGQDSLVTSTDRNGYRVVIQDLDSSEVTFTLDGQALTFTNVQNGESISIKEPGEDNFLTYLQSVEFTGPVATQWSRAFVWTNSGCVSRADALGTNGDDFIEDAIDESCYSRDYAGIFNNMFVDALAGNDYILGNNGHDQVIAGTGDDTVYGDEGNDRLYGGSGADYLYGNQGDDLLVGGTGYDDLYGDEGNDTYVFSTGFGIDYIYENQGANDTIKLLDYRFRDVEVTRVGDDLEIYIDADNYIIIRDHYYRDDYAIEAITFKRGKTLTSGTDF
ncbi:MAG: hypothetical protein ACJA1U_002265 [Bermanella sp.]|jgi:hypothetical protein